MSPAAETASRPGPPAEGPRLRAARMLLALALFLLPACAIATPWGLTPGAVAMLAAALLGADRLVAAWRPARPWIRPLWWLALLVLAVATGSMFWAGEGWREVDNHSRVLVMPLLALLVVALRPARSWLWAGAVAGLAGACVVMLVESHGGSARADGWSNAIVSANVAVGLMAVAIFCRPPGRAAWTVLAVLLGAAAMLLTGSRGVWPALAVLVVAPLVAGSWRQDWRQTPRTWALLACLLAALAVIALPLTLERMQALQTAMTSYEQGEHDTSYGARRDLLRVAVRGVRTHPLTGVGIGNFESYLATQPMCARGRAMVCELDHAHSDLPQWAATMGIPGLLAALLLYGVPLALFARMLRAAPRPMTSAAGAGLLFIACFVLGGMTQSMFAHQLTASLYAILVGVLTGFGVLERDTRARAPAVAGTS